MADANKSPNRGSDRSTLGRLTYQVPIGKEGARSVSPATAPSGRWPFAVLDLLSLSALLAAISGPWHPIDQWSTIGLFVTVLFTFSRLVEETKAAIHPPRYFAWWLSLLIGRSFLISVTGWGLFAWIPWERVILRSLRRWVEPRELANLDLRGETFVGWEFSDLKFTKVDFRLCDLRGAVFCEVTFTECNLEEVMAAGARFEGCSFVKCRLDLAELGESLWSKTQINGTSMTYSNLQGARFDPGCLVSHSDYDAANLTNCNLNEVDLKLVRA